jgi:hypothetical protein
MFPNIAGFDILILAVIVGVIGWAVIDSLLWLISFVHIG